MAQLDQRAPTGPSDTHASTSGATWHFSELNGPCYRSHCLAAALGQSHARVIRPHRPPSKKVERCNWTSAAEWAVIQEDLSDETRSATYTAGSITTITTDPNRNRWLNAGAAHTDLFNCARKSRSAAVIS